MSNEVHLCAHRRLPLFHDELFICAQCRAESDAAAEFVEVCVRAVAGDRPQQQPRWRIV